MWLRLLYVMGSILIFFLAFFSFVAHTRLRTRMLPDPRPPVSVKLTITSNQHHRTQLQYRTVFPETRAAPSCRARDGCPHAPTSRPTRPIPSYAPAVGRRLPAPCFCHPLTAPLTDNSPSHPYSKRYALLASPPSRARARSPAYCRKPTAGT